MSRRGRTRRLFCCPKNGKEAKTYGVKNYTKATNKNQYAYLQNSADFIRQIGLNPNTGIWLNTEVLQRNRIQLGSKMRYSTMDRQAVFFIVYRKNHLEI